MTMTIRIALTLAMYAATASVGWAQTAVSSWQPDEATVRSIEATLTLPSKEQWKPGPLDTYARYYEGKIDNGHRIIFGVFLRGQMATDKPGIYLHAPQGFSTGGGCDQIRLYYDVDAHQVQRIRCYGLG